MQLNFCQGQLPRSNQFNNSCHKGAHYRVFPSSKIICLNALQRVDVKDKHSSSKIHKDILVKLHDIGQSNVNEIYQHLRLSRKYGHFYFTFLLVYLPFQMVNIYKNI